MRCKNKVEFQFAWAGKLKKCCSKHARTIMAIGQVIGYPVYLEAVKSNDICSCEDNDEEVNQNGREKGRGWFGQKEEHARCGRLGGLVRARNYRARKEAGGATKTERRGALLPAEN